MCLQLLFVHDIHEEVLEPQLQNIVVEDVPMLVLRGRCISIAALVLQATDVLVVLRIVLAVVIVVTIIEVGVIISKVFD